MNQLKLNKLSTSALAKAEMNLIVGSQNAPKVEYSASCACACKYQNSGGSSTAGNSGANSKKKAKSPGMKSLDEMTLEEISNIDLNTVLYR